METIGNIFDDYMIILCYDDSAENTLKILTDYAFKDV